MGLCVVVGGLGRGSEGSGELVLEFGRVMGLVGMGVWCFDVVYMGCVWGVGLRKYEYIGTRIGEWNDSARRLERRFFDQELCNINT